MYGYVTVNRASLNEDEFSRFQACYCGLCHALQALHGPLSRLTLSYDMTVMTLIHSALYEPEGCSRLSRCVTHPFKPRTVYTDPCFDYGAHMSVILAYHKSLDDWRDERSLPRGAMARGLRGAYRRVRAIYPDHCAAIEAAVQETAALERAATDNIDALAHCTGRIVGRMYAVRDDFFAAPLYNLGHALGRFIYIMDAWDDLQDDLRAGRFNPLKAMSARKDYDAEIYDILTGEMAACCANFERLPIVRDANLIRNVLYSGVWTRWRQKHDATARRKASKT